MINSKSKGLQDELVSTKGMCNRTATDLETMRSHHDINTAKEMSPLDEYAELRYDPNWRKKQERSKFLQMNFYFSSDKDRGDIQRRAKPVSRHEYLVVHNPVSPLMDTVHPKPQLTSFHLYHQQDQDSVQSVPQSLSDSLENPPHLNSDKTMEVTRHESRKNRHEYLVVPSPVSPETDTIYPKPQLTSFHLCPPQDQDSVPSGPQCLTDSLETTPHSNSDKTMEIRRHVSRRNRREYVVVPSAVSPQMDTVHPEPQLTPFHLYPPQDQNFELSVPQSWVDSLECMPHSNSDQQTAAGLLPIRYRLLKQLKQSHKQCAGDSEGSLKLMGQKQNTVKDKVEAMQKRDSKQVQVPRIQRSTRPREDIIERNKATLGMNCHKQGSYLKAYEQRGKQDDSNTPRRSHEDTASTDILGSPDNALNQELMGIQKPQKPKTHNQSMHLDRAKPHQHITKPQGHLNQQVENQHSQTVSLPDSDSHSDFSFSSEPLINTEPQKQLNTPSLPSSPQCWTRNDECNSGFNRPRNSSARPPFQENCTLKAPKLAVHYREETYSGAYSVLPPIGRSSNSDSELSSGRLEEATYTVPKNNSGGYLARLKKQKSVQTPTYKAYTLKNYKDLNRNVNLGGLGPSNMVAKDVAKNIMQQKLYSNLVREQNKKLSRIPSVPTKDPVGDDNSNNIPRNKALEYAKTIAKPKAPQQLKETPKDKSKREFQHLECHQLGVDLTQQRSSIEMLRKRHEQEKQTVAHFTSIPNTSSTPTVNSH